MSMPTTPTQDTQQHLFGMIVIAVIGALGVVGVFVLIILDRATSEFTAWLMLFIPVIVGMLYNFNLTAKVQQQTNGQLTSRLDSQTADVINAVSTVVEKGTRPEYVPVRADDNVGE